MSVIDLSAARAERARAAGLVLDRARKILGRRALSCAEVRDALVREGFDANEAQDAVDVLVADRALDDAYLATTLIEKMQSRKQSSWRAITAELQRRKIDQEHWGESPERDDEFERALALVERRARSVPADADQSRKLQTWLARRGFDGATCRKAVESVVQSRGPRFQ